MLMVFSFLLSNAFGGEEDSLKESFEKIIECLNQQKIDCFLEGWHPEAVLVARNYLFPVDRLEAGDSIWKEIFQDLFDPSIEADVVLVDVDYRVIGEMGLVWGMIQTIIESDNRESRNQNTRLTATFKKTGNSWQIVSWHGSAPPN